MRSAYVLSWLIYGLVVIASGCYRYFSRPDGEKGLYFGLAMGALAVAGAAGLRSGRSRAGHTACWFSLVVVTGWCLYESLIKGGGNHELRLLLVAGLGVVQAGIAVAHVRSTEGAENRGREASFLRSGRDF